MSDAHARKWPCPVCFRWTSATRNSTLVMFRVYSFHPPIGDKEKRIIRFRWALSSHLHSLSELFCGQNRNRVGWWKYRYQCHGRQCGNLCWWDYTWSWEYAGRPREDYTEHEAFFFFFFLTWYSNCTPLRVQGNQEAKLSDFAKTYQKRAEKPQRWESWSIWWRGVWFWGWKPG